MSLPASHHTEPGIFPYRSPDREAFEEIAQPRLIPMPSQSLSLASSFYTSSETGSILDFSIPGFNNDSVHEGPADRSTPYDYPRPGRGDCCCGRGLSAPPRGYNSHVSGYPTSLTLSSSQFVQPQDNTLDELFPSFRTYGTIYTDDAAVKPGDGIRRQCSNCGATDTVTWRRSTLSPAKLVCNRCGLYERTHGVSRPKVFPRRRRSRPPSVRPNVNPPIGGEGQFRYIGPPSNMPFASYFADACDTIGGTTSPQGTSWVTYDMSDVSPTSSHTSPSYSAAEPPEIYHTYSSHYLPYLP